MAYNSSSIDANEAKTVLDGAVDIVNEMIQDQKDFEKSITEITNNWKGGGSSKNSALVGAVGAAKTMYMNMALAIAFGMQLIASVKVASNTLYKAYSGENEDLFA